MREESMQERQIRRAKRRARAWSEANEDCKRAEQARDEALWKCLERTVRFVKQSNFKTSAQVNSAVQEINPELDSRARSRYAKIVFEAANLAALTPADVTPEERERFVAWFLNGAPTNYKVGSP